MTSFDNSETDYKYKKIDGLCDILLQSSARYIEAYTVVNKCIPLEIEGFDQKFKEIRQFAEFLGVLYPFRVIRISLDTLLYLASLQLERDNDERSKQDKLNNNQQLQNV